MEFPDDGKGLPALGPGVQYLLQKGNRTGNVPALVEPPGLING